MSAPGPQGVGDPRAVGIDAQGPTYQMTFVERNMLQYTTDYYDQYWTNLSALKRFLAENAAGTRSGIYQAIQVPRKRAQPRSADDNPVGPGLNVTPGRAKYAASVIPQREQLLSAIEQGKYDIIQYTRPLGLELKKVLGEGGYGIACLFEFTDVDGTPRNLVVKASNNSNDISRELTHINVRWPPEIIPPRIGY